ncbi:hypothetical protein STCU_04114 [Strigomonas culicis]|uniref:RRM domain-containing protein n=1 Tax=Strigomonas culicis TaxID=28005 RepID=S9UHP1_9TRYP|nr:hypothetical protein STCU_04114 [Strigomonas culicis]|eukprot:EPY30342.1 hypothetical protein STCU_04114 [Strigomonas culicis]
MSYRVRISNAKLEDGEEELLRLCASFGEIIDYKVLNAPTPRDAPSVDVVYAEQEDADDAIGNMTGMEFHGVFLKAILIR